MLFIVLQTLLCYQVHIRCDNWHFNTNFSQVNKFLNEAESDLVLTPNLESN
jgi:hypothetical protein